MSVKKIMSTEELNNSISNGVSLIDFSGPWCAPCRAQEPIVRQMSEEYKGKVLIAEVNVHESRDTARDLEIRSIPTLAVIKTGKKFSVL